MTELFDHYIIISEETNKWDKVFHKKLIFNKLTDEHLLKLLTMQKIKYFTQRKTCINIYLDNFELEEFNLNPKLYTILKYHSITYGIFIHYINSPSELNDTEINNLNILNNHIDNNSKNIEIDNNL